MTSIKFHNRLSELYIGKRNKLSSIDKNMFQLKFFRIIRKSCGATEVRFRQVNPLLFKEGSGVVKTYVIARRESLVDRRSNPLTSRRIASHGSQ